MKRKQRLREHVKWTPFWGNEYAGYATNLNRSNHWRVDPINDMDDLLQDAYLIFSKVKDAYPRVIEARHFMALYKRALINSLHDKSSYKTRRVDIDVHLSSDATDLCLGRIGEVTNAGYVAALIEEMPEELKTALNMLARGLPAEKRRPHALQPRESLTMQLRRLLRLPLNSDPLTIIRRALST